MTVTKDSNIMEVINDYPETVSVLQKHGIGCIGCMLASAETLEQGLSAHGLDVEAIVTEMNGVITPSN